MRVDRKSVPYDANSIYEEICQLDIRYLGRGKYEILVPKSFCWHLVYLAGNDMPERVHDAMRAYQAGKDPDEITESLVDAAGFAFANLS